MSIDVSKPIPIVDGQKISREEFEKKLCKTTKTGHTPWLVEAVSGLH
jgi:hypothetical protein